MTKILIGLVGFFVFCGCTSKQVIRDSEYRISENAFKSGDPNQALEKFPKKESHGFVTSIEKSWLSFWQGSKTHEDLKAQSTTIQERQFTSVSKEAEYFFYSESEDGYIPAEHEIIILHLINSMYYMRNEKWADARVEAQKATFYIQNYFKDDQSHFDDPALRLWLAGVWSALGEWSEAQVDLRKAYELSKNESLLPLIGQNSPPQQLTLAFDGSGPQVTWVEGTPTPNFANKSTPPSTPVHFSTLPWYFRHQERNSLIRDVVMKSNYMAQYYGLNTSVGAEKTLGIVSSGTVKTVAIVTGAVIIGGGIYILVQSGSVSSGDALGGIIGAGILASKEIWSFGDKIAQSFEESTTRSKQLGLENLRTYRFVRFMPSWISLSPILEPKTQPFAGISLKNPAGKTEVLFLQRF